jgi:hypothetical protein
VPDEIGGHALRAAGDVAVAGEGGQPRGGVRAEAADSLADVGDFAGSPTAITRSSCGVNADSIREMSLASLVSPVKPPGP